MTWHTITVPGPMRGKQRARVTKYGAYTPPQTVAAEKAIGFIARTAQAPLLLGSVDLMITITVEPPKSWNKRMKAEALSGRARPTSKPDLDNVVKLIGDALNGIAWHDDAQITSVTAAKVYGPEAHTVISWRSGGRYLPPEPVDTSPRGE